MLTLLQNADVYAPNHLGTKDLLIAGGKIVAMDKRIDMPGGLAAGTLETVDLDGLRLVPGFIDPHVHSSGGGGESGPQSRVPPVVLSTLTQSGITTVVGVLGTDGTTRTMEDLVARTLGLRAEGISAYCYTGNYQLPPVTLTGSVRKDIVFVDPIIGFGEFAISDHRSSQPTFDEFLRLASDCHVAGLMSGKAGVLHLHLGDGERRLEMIARALRETELPARTFYPTHLNRNPALFEEALSMGESGVTFDLTAFPEADGGLLAEDAIEKWLEKGLPVDKLTCSSDASGCLPVFDGQGQMLHMDVGRPDTLLGAVRALLARGHDLQTILPVFTQNAGDYLRLGGKGQVAVGADADILVLDPKTQVHHLLGKGQWLMRAGESVHLGTFEKGLLSP